MPQILLAGAPTGCWTNLGDEAILAAMAASLRAAVPGVELAVVSSSPEGALAAHGCAEVPFRDLDAVVGAVAAADLVVLGGGSIFFDYWGCDAGEVLTPRHQGLSLWTGLALLAAAHEVPVMTWGVGVGPLRTDAGRLLCAAALELCGAVTVRDPLAAAAVAELPGDVPTPSVTGDPVVRLDRSSLAAFAAQAVQPASQGPAGEGGSSGPRERPDARAAPDGLTGTGEGAGGSSGAAAVLAVAGVGPVEAPGGGGHGPIVGVALRQWDDGVDPEAWPAEVAAALDAHLGATGGRALFVPCHRAVRWPLTDDVAAAEAVRSRMDLADRTATVDVDLPWHERAALLASCDEVLAMRYHAALVALRAGIPTVGVPYDPKVSALLDDWGVAELGLDVVDLAAGPLAERLARLSSEGGAVAARLATRAEELVARERGTVDAAASLLARRHPGGVDVAPRAGDPARRATSTGALLDLLGADPSTDRPAVAVEALDRLRARLGAAPAPRPRVALLTNRVLDRETGEARIGGAERFGLELARLLDDLGLEPTFFQLGGTWGTARFGGFDVIALPEPAPGESVSEFHVGATVAFTEVAADFDHAIVLMPNLAAGPLPEGTVTVCHGVWWDHEHWPHLSFRTDEWYEHLERMATGAARVVSVDDSSINVMRALFPGAVDRWVHVPNGVDVDEFHPPEQARTDDVPLVLLPRRAEAVRGAHLVGPLLAEVPDPCRFRWVGEGDPAMIDELGRVAAADPRLTVGTAGFDEMADLYRQADVVVIPTVASEGQSLACLEAMASGCAVVVTDVGGLPELVDDGVTGLVCRPTPASLGAAVRRLVRDPALRQRLGAAARAAAERRSLLHWRARWAEVLAELGWVSATTAAVPYDVVCFSICDWDFRWQRPQQLVSAWGLRGRRTFFLRITDHLPPGGERVQVVPLAEGVWEVRLALPEGFDVFTGELPDGFVEEGLASLAALRERCGLDRAVAMVQLASWTPLAEAARAEFGWRVLYDCMDDWSTFPGFDERPPFLALERRLVGTADVMVVSSRTIQERWCDARHDLVLARNASDFGLFHDALAAPAGGPELLEDVTGPVAGFFGAIVEWFDIAALATSARRRPDVTFVLIGNVARIDVGELEALPNVVLTGPRPYDELPGLLRRFDVALIPFVVGPATDGMDVVKLYEYLAQGVPVVSTPIREIVRYDGLVRLASTPEAFADAVDEALAEDDPDLRARRIDLARRNTWDDRLDVVEAALLDAGAGTTSATVGRRPGPADAVDAALAVTSGERERLQARIEELGTAGHVLRLDAEDARARLDALERSRVVQLGQRWWHLRAAVEQRARSWRRT